MDLLKSFNIEELPEHQTRTLHLVSKQPDFDLKLGFDACCTCGKPLAGPDCPPVPCRNCRRINYCSDACRQQDASISLPDVNNAEEEVDTALGHSAVVCAVLRICQDDEAVESNDVSNLEQSRIQASEDRIQSEKESYPATLANVIAEGPCYVEKLRSCSTVRRLVLHVIGASVEGELWDAEEDTSFVKAYAEALADLSEKNNLEKIELIFLGPECPTQNLQFLTPMQSLQKERSCGDLLVRTIKGHYTKDLLSEHEAPKPDIVVFFNPGFTVPEYCWNETFASIEKGITPFLLTTNTELEGIADCQYLLDQDMIRSIPPGLAQIFELYSAGDENQDDYSSEVSFFSDNPFSGSRVRQNGTMANDLFVKNHWILGGILDSYDPSKSKRELPSKRLKPTGVPSSSKAGNPFLI